MALRNPWVNLKHQPPYVLESDRPYVEEFNRDRDENDPRRLDLEMLPENVTGRRDAPVIHLQANPGKSKGDERIVGTPSLADLIWGNMGDNPALHINAYLLDEFEAEPGGKWWRGRYRRLIKECGKDVVARNVTCVEFHGYHSWSFAPFPVTLPSQRYGFDVVQAAMATNVVIVAGRARRTWYIAMPGLRDYEHLVELKNPRSASITAKNLRRGEEDFQKVLVAIKRSS
jgi:hypothetical protein